MLLNIAERCELVRLNLRPAFWWRTVVFPECGRVAAPAGLHVGLRETAQHRWREPGQQSFDRAMLGGFAALPPSPR